MYKSMILSIAAVTFIVLSLIGNAFAGTSVFRPRAFRMKVDRHKIATKRFNVAKTNNVQSLKLFNPTRTQNRLFGYKKSKMYFTKRQDNVLRKTIARTRARNLAIRKSSPGRKSGFSKERFGKGSVRNKFISQRSPLNGRF